MNFLAQELQERAALRPTVTKGEGIDVAKLLASEVPTNDEDATREYFFQSGVDEWYNSLEGFTFPSNFVALSQEDAIEIIRVYEDNLHNSSKITVPASLMSLCEKVQKCMHTFHDTTHYFVKLSTRSPKDSRNLFQRAGESYLNKMKDMKESLDENNRWIFLTEEVAKAGSSTNAIEAMEMFLDSERVAEDLKYACENPSNWNLSIVVRSWDSRVTLQSEFRSFVWNKKMNCMGQYFHPLYFPELKDIKEQIASDCLLLFDKIKDSLPVPNALVDFAWLGPGKVMLIEVNPLNEVLGSYSSSTGLFDWDLDKELIQSGALEFEIRVRNSPELTSNLKLKSRPEWKSLIYHT